MTRTRDQVRKVDVTRREKQVLERIVLGLSNKEISTQLGVAVPTVNQHVHSLLLKLGVQNRTQLAVAAIARKNGKVLKILCAHGGE